MGPHGGDRGGPSTVIASRYSAPPAEALSDGGMTGKTPTNPRPLWLTGTAWPPVAQPEQQAPVNCGLP